MARGREQAEWSRTAAVLAMLHNTHLGRRGSPKAPRDFNPYPERRTRSGGDAVFENLRDARGLFEKAFGPGTRPKQGGQR